MAALSGETGTLKFVHTYGAGLHSGDTDPDVHSQDQPRWAVMRRSGTGIS